MKTSSDKTWICPSAWNSIYFTHDGRLSPCCRFAESWKVEPGEAIDSLPELAKVKEQMLGGIAPEACRKCAAEELAGTESKRERNLRTYPEFRNGALSLSLDSLSRKVDIGLELGNACNLACITCNPLSSINWNKNAEAGGYARQPLFKSDHRQLRPHLENLSTLHLLGGEIFLMPALEGILKMIVEEGKPQNVYLKISTNVTVFPDAKVRSLLSEFGMVHILCSVDAYGPRNEYIRYPSKWENVQKTVAQWIEWRKDKFNVDIFLAPAISAYSLPGLPKLFDWWKTFSAEQGASEIGRNYRFGYVTDPEFQAAQVLARQVRENVALSFQRMPERLRKAAEPALAFSLHGDAYERRPKLLSWTKGLDLARDLNGASLVPEIFVEPA